MRKAGTITNKNDAERFTDYLLTEGIENRVDESPDGWAFWIIEEPHLARAKGDLEAFVADPTATKFQDRARAAHQLRRDEKKREKQAAKNLIDPRRQWHGRHTGRFPVTISLIVISVLCAFTVGMRTWNVAYANTLLFAPLVKLPDVSNPFLSPYAIEIIAGGQIWRLVTPIFMHGGAIHLLFNMYMTFQLGALVETRRGSWRFLLLVLATAASSNLGQYLQGYYWGAAAPFVVPFLGMSGVVYGLLGYAWMKSRFDPRLGIYVPPNLVVWLVFWLFLCMTGYVGRIANTAHIVGLLAGMAIGYAPVWWREMRR